MRLLEDNHVEADADRHRGWRVRGCLLTINAFGSGTPTSSFCADAIESDIGFTPIEMAGMRRWPQSARGEGQ
jgi:hypothetical protein